jgi:predicted transcriptional regulator
MSKTEVYSWRLDPDLKERLEQAARAEKTSVGALLDRIVREWFGRGPYHEDDEALQRRLRAESDKWIGSISSGDPYGSEQIKERVRAKLIAKHRRLQRDAPPCAD